MIIYRNNGCARVAEEVPDLPLFEQQKKNQPPTPSELPGDLQEVLYDTQNPEIWAEFEKIALKLIRQGITHYGAKSIFEVIRWHRIVRANDKQFKINNNYTAYYARKFLQKYPQYQDFFETRKSEE